MIQSCGVNSKLIENTNNIHRLELSSSDICKLQQYGLEFRVLDINNVKSSTNNDSIKVIEIIDNGRIDDTYCFTEDKRGTGIFNGVITGQCAEIIEYSDDNTTAVCNLASICLPKFVMTNNDDHKSYDYQKLIEICRIIVRNLDKIIDHNFYPTDRTHTSNSKHRPMGIGVQGLGDVYNQMGYAFDSDKAKDLNKRIFETIYYACLDESKELAKKYGKYSSFEGSPFSKGKLQFHLWNKSEEDLLMGYDWKTLIEEIKIHGTRNSLLTALMPTASTSQIMGNSECIEPYTSNIFKRSTLAGEFTVVNKNLMKDLIKLGLWSNDMRIKIIINNGSVQDIKEIPQYIKDIYKTAFEIKQMHLVQQSADRGIFIDQSQSFNLFFAQPNFNVLTSALIDAHDKGNKTGMYYYRSKPAVNPISFGIDIKDIEKLSDSKDTIDMIKKFYDINKKQTDTNDNDNDNDSNNQISGPVCQWKPGMKREECLVCSA
jgi:ribonucleotide reductase alpha subunit